MKSFELEAALKRNGPAACYLVVGEEDYLRDRSVSGIKAAVLADSGTAEFNLDVLHGDETDASEILARASEAPAFAERRCLIVKTAEKLSAREGERLLEYVKAPCESTTLIFAAVKLDGRTKFAQALKERAVTVECSLPPEAQLSDWIKREAVETGVRLGDDAVDLLRALMVSLKESTSGGVLYLLRRELEKLAAYVPAGAAAGVAEVEAVRGGEAGASVFDLCLAIAARDAARALRILNRNLDTGEDPLRILGSLVWQYRKIWRLKEQMRQGGGEGEAARVFRMPPFKVREFLGRFSDADLSSAFRRFVQTDSKLKGGSPGASRARVMEELLLALSKGSPAPAGPAGPTRPAPNQNVRTVRPSGPTR